MVLLPLQLQSVSCSGRTVTDIYRIALARMQTQSAMCVCVAVAHFLRLDWQPRTSRDRDEKFPSVHTEGESTKYITECDSGSE